MALVNPRGWQQIPGCLSLTSEFYIFVGYPCLLATPARPMICPLSLLSSPDPVAR